MKINKILVNNMNDGSKIAQKIYKTAKDTNTPIAEAPDDKIVYEEQDLKIKTFVKMYDSDNESSVISLLSYKDFDMLFTGDAGVEAFRRISDKMPDKVEVLKVGHHGASGVVDKACINRLKPEVSIISTGKNNYGHPNNVTLDILRNTEIYRTDRNNSVKVSTDGFIYRLYTFNSLLKQYELISTRPAQ